MGCTTSKLDNLPAVALCRDRCKFLDDALHHSYALADAHVAYLQSLKTVGPTLHQFFEHYGAYHRGDATSNGDPAVKSSKSSPPDRSPSSLVSDSHIQFDSDSEEEDRNKDFESFNRDHHNYFNQETLSSSLDMLMSVNYNNSSRSYRYNDYSTYNVELSEGDWAHKTPPPPTPSSYAWDFLNFFEPLEKYEPPYSPNHESKQQVNQSERNHDKISTENDEVKVKPHLLKEKDDEGQRKKVVSEKERSTKPESKSQSGQQGVSEVMKEVENLYERASESGSEVLKMFDAGKFRYHHKYSVSQGNPLPIINLLLELHFTCLCILFIFNTRTVRFHYPILCETNKYRTSKLSLQKSREKSWGFILFLFPFSVSGRVPLNCCILFFPTVNCISIWLGSMIAKRASSDKIGTRK